MAWTFEDKFNSDTKSTGDLNGQDGWSGGTSVDIVTTTPFEGDQHVSIISSGAIEVSFTAVTDGTFYFSFFRVDTTGDATFDVEISGGGNRIRYILGNGGEDMKLTASDGAGVHTLLTTILTGQWYTVELNFTASDTHTTRVHDGTGWSALSGSLDAETGNGGDIATLNMATGGGAGVCHFDDITPTNPFPFKPKAMFI